MKIRVDDIIEAGLSLDVAEDAKVIEGLAGSLGFRINAPVRAHFDVTRTGKDINVTGALDTALGFACGRCLKDFESVFSTGFSIFYTLGRESAREKGLTAADIDVNYITGDTLDTSEIILAQLALEAPLAPLCNEDCKGLCPRCGADLNAGPCGCGAEEKTDVRFAKLKDFKVK
ncbi:MAG: DUF177 domain-containing protein [Deltaproteobacteria bacterium]|nr:DUF177 domain-containing protein [Deltaproteobacteria bacterium]